MGERAEQMYKEETEEGTAQKIIPRIYEEGNPGCPYLCVGRNGAAYSDKTPQITARHVHASGGEGGVPP